MALLALGAVGIVVAFGARSPYYRFLFQSFGDAFRAIRAPSRAIVLFHVALAVLAAWGLALLLRGRAKGRRLAWTGAAVLVLVLEYRAFPLTLEPTPAAPPPVYAWLASLEMPGAVVEWPFGLLYDFDYVFRQAAHGKPLLNGYSGFFPATYTGLEAQLKQRPIPDAVWPRMGDARRRPAGLPRRTKGGASVVTAYADALDRALDSGGLELDAEFPTTTGRTSSSSPPGRRGAGLVGNGGGGSSPSRAAATRRPSPASAVARPSSRSRSEPSSCLARGRRSRPARGHSVGPWTTRASPKSDSKPSSARPAERSIPCATRGSGRDSRTMPTPSTAASGLPYPRCPRVRVA